jgi:hypothetical protein
MKSTGIFRFSTTVVWLIIALWSAAALADTIAGSLTVTHADNSTAQVAITGTAGSFGGQCPPGQVVYGIASNGSVLCVADQLGPVYSFTSCSAGQFMVGNVAATGAAICATPPSGGGSTLPVTPPQCLAMTGSTCNLNVQSDGGLIINQTSGATYADILRLQYLGVTKFQFQYNGNLIATTYNGAGGLFTTDASGNVIAADATTKHLIGGGISHSVGNCGASPSVSGKGAFARITVGTGSPASCTLTFGSAYATAPACNAQGSVSGDTKPATTTTSATFSAPSGSFADGEVLHVVCGSF